MAAAELAAKTETMARRRREKQEAEELAERQVIVFLSPKPTRMLSLEA